MASAPSKVPQHFAKFIALFEKNKVQWTTYLMDHGKGNPPVAYLAAFEEGLRNYGSSVHNLGTRPLAAKQKNVGKCGKVEEARGVYRSR